MKLGSRAAIGVIAALFICGSVLLFGAPAVGHEEQGLGALSVLHRINPEMPGVEVLVTHPSVPIMTIRNRSDRALLIEGLEGEPFLRIGTSVELNALSATSYQSLDPGGQRPLPPGLNADKEPRWVEVAHDAKWSWLDPRIVFGSEMTLDSTWEVRGTWGDQPITIEGGFEPLEGHGHFSTAIDISDRPNGLDIQFLFGNVPGIYVRNSTGKVLQVPGLQDEPFLRIGPRGTFANMRSPTYHFAGTQALARVPQDTDPSAKPSWKRVSSKPIWAWLELRARLPAEAQLRSVLGAERRTVLSWTTPMYLAGDLIELKGELDWIPPSLDRGAAEDDAGFNPMWGIVAVAWLGVGALAIQRRRSRARRGLEPSEVRRARA
ncbi:MAG TPA: hypothetical protein VHJ82_02335 [Actinomycetota bacterium]|nr:hypothetical protein [Actinomycetota bacterium]